MKNKVAILMATYNGEKFIHEQIRSIMAQTYIEWSLLIRDDGSTDRTVEIIREYATLDERVNLIEDGKGHLGNCGNFSVLMDYAEKYQYIFFSDQDDYWFEDKIEKQMDILSKYGERPTAVYTNYYLADEKLNNRRIAYLRKLDDDITLISVENYVMGCTMAINHALLNITKGIPDGVDGHDRWIATIAKAYNGLAYDEEPHIYHRIHNKNTTTVAADYCLPYRIKRYFQSIKRTEKWIETQYLFHKEVGIRLKKWKKENEAIEKCEYVFSGKASHPIIFCIKNKIKNKNMRRKFYMYYALRKYKK